MKTREFAADEIKNIIEGKGHYDRIPMVYNFWSNPIIFKEHEEEARKLMEEYPCDADWIFANFPDNIEAPEDDPEYRWMFRAPEKLHRGGIDSNVLLESWDDLDEMLEHFPNPDYPGMFSADYSKSNKYKVVCWWYCYFERMWSFRGMENALMDFYIYPDKVHRLFRYLTDFYKRAMERAHNEMGANAIFTSDDIGTQTSQFFSEDIFLEFFKPYYKELIDKAHSLGMHFWLHSCGNIKKFIPHFVDIGLDVLHPIQKYTMDEAEIAKEFGDKITIWAGFDVQRTIPYGTPEDVRREVRFMIDTYARRDGRLMLTCGNGLTEDCSIESFRALLDESLSYGTEKMSELNRG